MATLAEEILRLYDQPMHRVIRDEDGNFVGPDYWQRPDYYKMLRELEAAENGSAAPSPLSHP